MQTFETVVVSRVNASLFVKKRKRIKKVEVKVLCYACFESACSASLVRARLPCCPALTTCNRICSGYEGDSRPRRASASVAGSRYNAVPTSWKTKRVRGQSKIGTQTNASRTPLFVKRGCRKASVVIQVSRSDYFRPASSDRCEEGISLDEGKRRRGDLSPKKVVWARWYFWQANSKRVQWIYQVPLTRTKRTLSANA